MKIVLTSIVVAVLLAAGVGYLLSTMQKPVYEARAAPSVRIGDPGHNLVGPDWSGLNRTNGGKGQVSHVSESKD
jgi:hypothetical protein